MPNQLAISSINVVASAADNTTAAKDRPVTPNELETLGVTDDFLAASGFEGNINQTALLPERDAVVIAVGLGNEEITTATGRSSAAALWHASKHLDSLTSLLPLAIASELGAEIALQAVVEGMLLASYSYDELKGSPENTPNLQQITLVVPDGVDSTTVLQKAESVANGIALSRDLVNRPGGSLSAPQLADEAMAVADQTGLEIEVWDRERLVNERCGGILGVNAGSLEEPRLIRLT